MSKQILGKKNELMNLRGTISEYERKLVDKTTPQKDLYAAKREALLLDREMTRHQRNLHIMDSGHTKVDKIVGYGCQ